MADLRQFRQFIAVAEERNFRRAAERLHMAQPPLSQAIRKLEDEIGVRLLDRDRHSVRCTPAGEAFLEEARHAVAQAAHAVATARKAGKGEAGQLRIAFVGSATYAFLPQVVRAYRARHPGVLLELIEGSSVSIAEAVDAEQADVGFLRPPVAGRSALAIETVLRERFVAALQEGHPLATRRGLLRLGELSGEEFVIFSATTVPALHLQILRACREAGFSPRLAQHATQIHTITSLVAAGLGVALVPEAARRLSQAGVAFRAFADRGEALSVDLAAATRRDRRTPAVLAFLDIARRVGAGEEV